MPTLTILIFLCLFWFDCGDVVCVLSQRQVNPYNDFSSTNADAFYYFICTDIHISTIHEWDVNNVNNVFTIYLHHVGVA